MSTRIRYEKYEDPNGLYDHVSTRNFHSNRYVRNTGSDKDAMYIVYLDSKFKNYLIKNLTRGTEFTGGEGINNLHVLKRKIKSQLEKLGVSFSSEIRDNKSRVKGVNCGYKSKTLDNSEKTESTDK